MTEELGRMADATGLSSQAIEPVSRLDPDGLQSLALRCEQEAQPDEELDELIAATIAGATIEWQDYKEANAYHRAGRWVNVLIAPYTASLDAAMTLVPEGWNWMASNRNLLIARAYVENGELFYKGMASRKNPRKQWFECVAATPALALCAAALKARASQADTHPKGGDAKQGSGSAG